MNSCWLRLGLVVVVTLATFLPTLGMRAPHFKLVKAYGEDERIAEAIEAYREAIRPSGPTAP